MDGRIGALCTTIIIATIRQCALYIQVSTLFCAHYSPRINGFIVCSNFAKRRITHKSEKFIIIYCNLYTIRQLRHISSFFLLPLLQFRSYRLCAAPVLAALCIQCAPKNTAFAFITCLRMITWRMRYNNVIRMRSARDQNKCAEKTASEILIIFYFAQTVRLLLFYYYDRDRKYYSRFIF